jgi:hypothetical protein
MNRKNLHWLVTLSLALTAFTGTPATAQHVHDHQHTHGEVAKPKTLREALRRIADHTAFIDSALKSGSVAGVSDNANSVAELARQLGALALAKDSGLTREKVRDFNLAGKELADAANTLHELADGGDLNDSKAQFVKVQAAFGKIDALAPAFYHCPMHCEDSKSYAAPGQCPVCKMDLKKITTDKYSVEVKVLGGKVEAGTPVTLLFTVKDPTGAVCKDLQIVHEKPLHLLMTSKDLSWFAHEHPEIQPDGTFVFENFTFPTPGEYMLWHDCTPAGVGMQVIPVSFTVPGTPPAAKPLRADSTAPKTIDGYTFAFSSNGPLRTGKNEITFTVSQNGAPVTDLEPLLGAMGHLVIISSDQKEFVHSHPHEANQYDPNRRGGPAVTFEAFFQKPGTY